jgi:hypothetical protein
MIQDMDEPWKRHAKWKNVDTKSYVFYDSIYIYKCPELAKSVTESLTAARDWGKETRKWLLLARGSPVFWGQPGQRTESPSKTHTCTDTYIYVWNICGIR